MGFSFRPPWWSIVLVLASMSLFIKLGVWQVHRATEKEQLILQSQQSSLSYKVLKPTSAIKQFQKLEVAGAYQGQDTFLLDNRFYQHRVGFEVINILKTDAGPYLLVDRGWISATNSRRILPTIPLLKAKSLHKGQAYYPSKQSWVLDDTTPDISNWPVVIEKLDIPQLSALLNHQLYPFILRLDKTDPNSLVRDWQVVTMKPEKHRGYAFQWFSFAMIALIIFFILNVERKKHAS